MDIKQKALAPLLIAVTAQSLLVHAVDMSINLRAGGQLNYLSIQNNKDTNQPFFELLPGTDQPTYPCDGTSVKVNSGFASNDANNRGTVKANNIDIGQYPQISVGLKGIILQDANYPSDTFSYGITSSISGVYEASPVSQQANLYITKPLSAGSIDIGVLTTNNGNAFELGGGFNFLRYEFTTGEVFEALGFMSTATAGTSVPKFIKTDKSPYVAMMDYNIAPYFYAELSTHVGDLLTVYTKAIIGQEIQPDFTPEADVADSQMFSGDQNSYQNDHTWQLNSFNVGVQISLS